MSSSSHFSVVPTSEDIQVAAQALVNGALVAFPTETVYGLGADAENIDAVAKIYQAKGRPSNHPVIVHVAPEADLSYWVRDVPKEVQQLIKAFWPGPLTLILQRAKHIPDAVSGGQDSVGIRCPSHPVAIALLRAFSKLKGGQGGVAAPSANKFGHVSPTIAEHVREEFDLHLQAHPLIDMVLDGGQSEVGIESTILDLSRLSTHGAVLLRPGHITADQLTAVLGFAPTKPDASAPRASGTLEAHYAPMTPVALIAESELEKTIFQLNQNEKKIALITHIAHIAHLNLTSSSVNAEYRMPQDAVSYAHDLYAAMREMDHTHSDIILIVALPEEDAWQGVNDRLRRAAFDSRTVLQTLLM